MVALDGTALQGSEAGLKPFQSLPTLKGHWLKGALTDFATKPIPLIERAFQTHGDLVRLRLGPVSYLLVSHPEALHHILVENQRNYRKDTKGYQGMKKLLGEGLVTSNGDFWLRQRRIAQPGFHRERIQGFADTMTRCTEEMLDDWAPRVAAGEKIDINEEMMRLTLRIIGLTMMSVDLVGEARDIGDALTVCLHRTDEIIKSLPLADLVPNKKNRAFRRGKALLDATVHGAIRERRAAMARGEKVPDDLLTMLLEARDPETGEGMNDQQLRDEVMTIFLAGHETTSNALTWTFRLLADHPEERARLFAEVDAAGKGPFTMSDLRNLPYARQAIDESMRLLPPVWMVGRNSTEDDELLGTHIPGRTNVFLSIWNVHRHPAFWKEPLRFDPDRFAGDPRLPKGLYIPFIEGPRQCIGKAFALMEAHLLLVNIARRFQLDLSPGQKVELDPSITLRPLGGLPMVATARG